MAKIFKASNKNGQDIISRAKSDIGYTLFDVYKSGASSAKWDAYNRCSELFYDTNDAHDFHICSKNTFMFTVAWYGLFGGNNALFYITRDHDYIVLLDK